MQLTMNAMVKWRRKYEVRSTVSEHSELTPPGAKKAAGGGAAA